MARLVLVPNRSKRQMRQPTPEPRLRLSLSSRLRLRLRLMVSGEEGTVRWRGVEEVTQSRREKGREVGQRGEKWVLWKVGGVCDEGRSGVCVLEWMNVWEVTRSVW